MANLDDLSYDSITEMSSDEGLERLRQIRLSRRASVKTTRSTTTKKAKDTPVLNSEQAAELLKLLTGGK
jgi:hypothetical protein